MLDESTIRTMELLSETAQYCESLGIDHLTGGLVPYAIQKKRIRNFPKASIYVLVQDMPNLHEIMINNRYSNRLVELSKPGESTNVLGFKYIDTGTTFIDLNEDSPNYQGIHIEILPLLNENIFLQDMASNLERSAEFSYGGHFVYGLSLADACAHYAAFWDGPLCLQNTHGKLVAFPIACSGRPRKGRYLGYDVKLPRNLDRYCNALYRKGKRYLAPNYPRKESLISAETPYSSIEKALRDRIE